ncbi:DNA GYRASE SUBUNIT A [Mycoplasmopsis pulmonis]|uniref:DNA gyrase subunit A n=1 Tax=Mycoplasmopsis pulmonis (strain UAB CTIP) TaxID=272635 RepID=Q98R63_MYCPU|nr:DNA gyrase subunit A [Mycoplasmopsis pulmonis]MDZ7293116.1 DNA gyrase subunit A [Mycoplasmopsis pulmonis]CAC13320.1 DNA GYRASE SUBUNIT A [Mycoplasmopsis pulmonis]VEU67912.1 DNA gyrase subunit A [Mycoplasmopsis pulmonis]
MISFWNYDDNDEDDFLVADDELKVVFKQEETKKEIIKVEEEIIPQEDESYQVKSQLIEEPISGLAPVTVSKEMQNSFLEYAMSVIVSRAIPDARDGLKPVHRRILYGMFDLGLHHSSAFKKSARIVGDVLGKYHPHGDASVYEAMVRMAQEFSMRYPLVDGHGNFGSIDGDPAAAMRYTEARLSKLSAEMLNGIRKNTVNFIPNYDASEVEPEVLPSRFPNLLVTGGQGIAVGMATTIAPHNLAETISATIAYARNPQISLAELMEHIKGPDFPTGGIILGTKGIIDAFETGKGSISIRSKTEIEYLSNGKTRIIVSEIPYSVQKTTIIEKIALLVKEKVIEGISDLRDETNRKGIRIVIEVKKNFVPEVVLNKLFKTTNLQLNFNVNMVALVNGEPKLLSLKDALRVYLDHQKEIVIRRLKFDLEKSEARLHILEGLKIAVSNIDEVIRIIRASKTDSEAQEKLGQKFSLSEIQTKAIVEMRLGRLTGLAIEKMEQEIQELLITISNIKEILNSEQKLIDLIVEELEEIKEKYGDKRLTQIDSYAIANISDEDLIPERNIAIIQSVKGYVKRINLSEYKVQNRGGVGTSTAKTYEDDDLASIITTTTHTDLLIFTSFAKVYRIRAHQIPESSKQSKGIPFINLIQIEKDEEVVSILPAQNYDDGKFLVTLTQNGLIKKTKIEHFQRINTNGKIAMVILENDKLVRAMILNNDEEIIVGSSEGKIVRFDLSEVRDTGRKSAGVRAIKLAPKHKAISLSASSEGKYVFSLGSLGFGKKTPIEDYRKTKRAAKGVITIKVDKAGKLVHSGFVEGSEDIIILNSKGIAIRTSLEQVSDTSRSTKGVKIIQLKKDEKIKSLTLINVNKIDEEISKTQEIEFNMNLDSNSSE